jgi:hypothetical protein
LKSKIKELIQKEIEAIQNIPIDGIIEVEWEKLDR